MEVDQEFYMDFVKYIKLLLMFAHYLDQNFQQLECLVNDVLYKQKDSVAMGLPVRPTMANFFLSFYKIKWLEQYPKEFKPVFYRRYVNDIFVLFKLTEHLSKFCDYFNTCHPNKSFSLEQEKNGKLSFLHVEVSWEKGKFVTTVYRKPTFRDVFTHFESFLPTVYEFGMVYTLAYFCFKICSECCSVHYPVNEHLY